METYTVTPTPYPIQSKTSQGLVASVSTTATSLLFFDKILLTLTSHSHSPSHWIHVPLSPASNSSELAASGSSLLDNTHDENSLLPRLDLTATTVFGGTRRGEEEMWGQTLATTVATALLMKRPGEERLLVLGLGLDLSREASAKREVWDEIIGLCLDCL